MSNCMAVRPDVHGVSGCYGVLWIVSLRSMSMAGLLVHPMSGGGQPGAGVTHLNIMSSIPLWGAYRPGVLACPA